MPKTSRANARPTRKPKPAEPHDAELIALAHECADAAMIRAGTSDALEMLEIKYKSIEAPGALLKTKRDLVPGDFAGCDLGTPYIREEIDVVRLIVRRSEARTAADPTNLAILSRGSEVLGAWAAWQRDLKTDRSHAILSAAKRTFEVASNRYEALVERLLSSPAATFEGLLAKAYAFDSIFADNDVLARKVMSGFERFGPDDDVLAHGLAHDLVRLRRLEARDRRAHSPRGSAMP